MNLSRGRFELPFGIEKPDKVWYGKNLQESKVDLSLASDISEYVH